MHGYKERSFTPLIKKHLEHFPCVALLGARQVGKSTLAQHIIKTHTHEALYLDLENPSDLNKLTQAPLSFLNQNRSKLICLDEIQRLPEIFPILRGYLDQGARAGQLLLLGSASKGLIRQSSETLAGRISYIEIPPFLFKEVEDLSRLWLQGGYPASYLAPENISFEWRKNYISTFLERDLPSLGFNIPPERLRRFWQMLAHSNGELLNSSKLASSMGLSSPTIQNYLDILEGTFVVRQLRPYFINTKKRLVKSPKIYFKDTGLLHALLGISSLNDLFGHHTLGSSFEALAIQTLIAHFRHHEPHFYRTSNGAELDLILTKGQETLAFEIKAAQAPQVTKGFYESLKSVQPTRSYVICQTDQPYPIKEGAWVHNLESILKEHTLLN